MLLDMLIKKIIPMKRYPDYLRKKGLKLGENCVIYKNVDFGSEPYLITIGNNVRITAGVKLTTHDGGLWVLRFSERFRDEYGDADKFGRITIGNNVHIGLNAVIMPGVSIGDDSIIGCGAVVTHNVPSGTIVGGVPARPIETIEEYAEKLRGTTVNTKHMSHDEKREYIKRYLG